MPRLIYLGHAAFNFKTFDVIDVEPEEFVKKVQSNGQKAQVLPIGDSLEY